MRIVPAAVLQLAAGQLLLLLLLLLAPSPSQSQRHPPGTGWPLEGASAPIIVHTQARARGVYLDGAIDTPGGSVWYSFDAVADHAYVISTRLADLADSTLSLWETTSSSGLDVALVAGDDDSGLGLASLLAFVPPRDGTLYVRVRGYSSVQVGRFNITIVDATAGMSELGPAPCVSSAGGTSCVLPLGCIESFNDHRETCPGGGDGHFSCESRCAALLVPWYDTVQEDCQRLLTLMPEWSSYTALSECNAAVYGGADRAILIRVGESQPGRIGTQGYREWFKFQASSGASYVITTTLDGQSADSLRDSVLDLYSTDSTSVLMTNDDYDGLASQISWTAPTTRCLDSSSCIYFLTVRGYNVHDLGSFHVTLDQRLEQRQPEADLCTENGDRVPWRAIEFRPGCEVWVSYEEVSSAEGQQEERMQLLEVGGVSLDRLLHVTSDICGSMDLARVFAEDFEGVAELAGVRVSGEREEGQVELAVRSSTGAVTHPTVTFTQMNQRYTRAQWRDDHDERIFSGRTCPVWTDDDSAVTAEIAVDGSLSPAEFQAGIAAILAAQPLGSDVQPAHLVTITSYAQTLASAMIVPGIAADFSVNDADSVEVSSVIERQEILRSGIAESINCCVPNVAITGADVVITGATSATVGRRRQLQGAERVRVSYELVTESENVLDWVEDRYYGLRLANTINDADTVGLIDALGVLNFASESPDVTTSVKYTLDTSAMSPTARSSLVLNLGTEAAVLAALNSQLPENHQIGAVTFVSLQAATGTDPQCATYLFSSLTGSDFSSTLVENGAITGNEILLGDESLSSPIDVRANGLTFSYFQRAVRWIVVSSNGFVYVRGDDTNYEALRQLSTGRGSGERLPAPSYGALIAPYWEDYDPSGVQCGNSAGRIHWKIMTTGGGSGMMVVEFDRVKACGGGTDSTKNVASWQLVLKGTDDSFDIVISHARGDSGLHTIGFQDWDGREGQMICHGEGDSKCFKQSTTYRVTSVRPSYMCHASGVCATAAAAAQGGGPAGSNTSSPRYAACECPDCFSGDGLSACMPDSCSQSTSSGAQSKVDTADTSSEVSLAQLLVAVLVTLVVGVGGNTVCHRWSRCPMYRPKIVPAVVHVTQGGVQLHQPMHPQNVVLGTIVGQPPLPVGASVVHSHGLPHRTAADAGVEHNDERGSLNPLITMARVVNVPDGETGSDKAKGDAWATGGGSSGDGARAMDRREP